MINRNGNSIRNSTTPSWRNSEQTAQAKKNVLQGNVSLLNPPARKNRDSDSGQSNDPHHSQRRRLVQRVEHPQNTQAHDHCRNDEATHALLLNGCLARNGQIRDCIEIV